MLQHVLKRGIQRIGWAYPSVRRFATAEVADKICLTFASSSKVFYNEASVQQLNVPTIDGEVGIYPTHVPLVGVLKPGIVTVTSKDNDVKKYFVSSGSLAINEDSSVQLLAEEACTVEELDLQQCELGLEKAKSQAQAAAGDEKAQAEHAIAIEVYEALVKACHEAA
uniref:F-ATPase delta subunit n=1 Tax=Trichuris muris TaxID=70415 RepID=A0A5S6Q7D0_TRIMR